MDCHFFLQGIFWHLLHWQANSLPLSYLGKTMAVEGHAFQCILSIILAFIAFLLLRTQLEVTYI